MLKVKDVWTEQENQRERRMRAMRPVLAKIFSQIKTRSIHQPGAPYIVFEVPDYVFGYPLFNVAEARTYLQDALAGMGYKVWPVDDSFLLISWAKPATGGGSAMGSVRTPTYTANYRPQIYDPSQMPFQ